MPTFIITHGKAIFIAIATFLIVSYVIILKHENNSLKRDNESLKVTIETTKVLGQQQNEKSDRIEQGSRKAAEIITSQYQTDLQKVKDYYAKNPVVKYKPDNHVVSVCNNPTDNRTSQVPTTDTSTSRTNERAADQRPSGQSLEQDCAETTLMLLKLQEFETKQQEVQ